MTYKEAWESLKKSAKLTSRMCEKDLKETIPFFKILSEMMADIESDINDDLNQLQVEKLKQEIRLKKLQAKKLEIERYGV